MQIEGAAPQTKFREAGRQNVSQQEPKNPLNPPSSHTSPVSRTPLPQRGKSGKKGRLEGITVETFCALKGVADIEMLVLAEMEKEFVMETDPVHVPEPELVHVPDMD